MGKRQSRKAPAKPVELPDAELEVLACLWHQGPQTAAEIRKQLHSFRPMAHGSVVTLLSRLVEKDLVAREKSGQGKAFLFRAVHPAEPTLLRIVRQLKNRIFGGSRVAMLASLLEIGPPSPKELDEMRGLLDSLKQSEKSSEGERP